MGVGLFFLFLGIEYGGAFSVETLSPYAIYIFEALWAGIALYLFRPFDWKTEEFSFGYVVTLFFSLVAGFAIFESVPYLKLILPFDMKNPEIVLFLVVIGPILEEFLFRGAIWNLLREWFRSPLVPYLVTSVLFAYAHFHEIKTAPEEFHGYIRYQAVYTLALGLLSGGVRMRFGLLGAVLIHLSFNFGFFFGSI